MKIRGILLITALAMLLAVGATAQTTGTIEGTVVDENNQALPGVTVEGTSPNLQGTKVAVTSTDGGFRLVLLPPGTYMVKFNLAGFATTEQSDVSVGLGRTVTLQVSMRSSFKEEVVVSGAAPLIDIKSTEMGANVNQEFFNNIPTQRNFASVLMVSAGTAPQGDENNCPNCVSVYGSTGSENAYYIDGVNTTGVEVGTQGKALTFEFIQEAQIKTGGYQAEFGRATGGLINVITKSGGNEFRGDVFGYFETPATRDSVKTSVIEDSLQSDRSFLVTDRDRQDYGLDVGGYIIKDKIWFFGAYDRLQDDEDQEIVRDFLQYGGRDIGFPKIGDTFVNATTRDLWSAKLTYRASQNHSFIISAFGDPSTQEGPIRGLARNPAGFMGTTETGGTDGLVKYEGVLGANWVVSAQAAQHREKNIEGGEGFPSDLQHVGYIDYTHPLFINTGVLPAYDGLAIAFRQEFGRDTYRADASYFLNNFGGDHEFKIGIEGEHITVLNFTHQSRIRVYCQTGFQTSTGCTPGHEQYVHEYYIDGRPPGVDPNNPADDAVDPTIGNYYTNSLQQDSKSNTAAVYLQDTWRMSPTFTLSLGLRYEEQTMYDKTLEVADNGNGKIDGMLAPRLGFVWDYKGDGSSKLYGSYGRFYETIPMDMIIRAFGGEISVLMTNSSPDPNNAACDPTMSGVNGYRRCRIVGSTATPVDPNLKGQYIDEIVLGVESEMIRDWVFGAKYIRRDLGQVIEDALGFDQSYYIGNPGSGYLGTAWDESYTYQYESSTPERTFEGVELNIRKRFSNNWQMIASYLYSELKGTYDGTFQASTGQLDPNLNSAYDYAEFAVNNTGYLSNDRRQQLMVTGSYNFNFGLNVGGGFYYRTGTPMTAMGYSAAYRNFEYYLSERGEFGRTDDEWEGNLHLGYPIKIGNFEVNLLADIFNLFDRQAETARNTHYDIQQDYDVIDYNTGEAMPPITQGDATRPPTNPSFNATNQWQTPRQIRLGVRVTF